MYHNDAVVKELINKNIVKVLALGIASVIIVLNPEIIVINGEIVELGDEFLKLLKNEIYSIIPYRTEIVYSTLRNKSKIFGSIRNGLNYIEEHLYTDPESFYKIR